MNEENGGWMSDERKAIFQNLSLIDKNYPCQYCHRQDRMNCRIGACGKWEIWAKGAWKKIRQNYFGVEQKNE